MSMIVEDYENEDYSFIKTGYVITVIDGVIETIGLDDVSCGELIYVGRAKNPALVVNLEHRVTKAILLVKQTLVSAGDIVEMTNKLVSVGVSGALLGRVVDGLGNFIDEDEKIEFEDLYDIDIKAPGVISRQSVCEPMPTGIKIIDSMLPIGNGQRELIIGDRQTGKTSIAVDTIINQKK